MKSVVMKLMPYQNHIGFCQLTYTSRNDEGQKLVYCLQEDFDQIRLMRCTQECEPCHEVKFTQVKAVFERPVVQGTDTEYTVRLKNKCIEWIEKYDRSM